MIVFIDCLIKDIDDCKTNECRNGKCVDALHSYHCDCTGTGFEGEKCEQGMNIKIIL